MLTWDMWKMLLELSVWEKRGDTTYCNFYVMTGAAMEGCLSLWGKTANEQVTFMEQSRDWEDVGAETAQIEANRANLVIAGYKSAASGHGGHVCAVVKGYCKPSANFNGPMPIVANVGKTNFYGKHAGFAFPKDKKPKFFVWKLSSE